MSILAFIGFVFLFGLLIWIMCRVRLHIIDAFIATVSVMGILLPVLVFHVHYWTNLSIINAVYVTELFLVVAGLVTYLLLKNTGTRDNIAMLKYLMGLGWKKILLVVLLFGGLLLVVYPDAVLGENKFIFTSPDESANYIVARWYAQEGTLYQDATTEVSDPGNIIHPRGILRWDNKLVPFSFPGLPLIHGTFMVIFGDGVFWVNSVMLLLATLTITRFVNLLSPNQRLWKLLSITVVGLMAMFPAIYWFGFTFVNMVPASTLLLVMCYGIWRWFKVPTEAWPLYLSCLVAVGAVMIRYEFVLYIAVFVMVSTVKLWPQLKLKLKKQWSHLILATIVGGLILVGTLALIHTQLYGDPLTYGYSIFNQVYYPLTRTASIIQTLSLFITSSYVFDLPILLKNVILNFFIVSPIFFFGLFYLATKYKAWKAVGVMFVFGLYVIIYTGMSRVDGASNDLLTNPGTLIRSSVSRYWMLVYLSLTMLFVWVMTHARINTIVKLWVFASVMVSVVVLTIGMYGSNFVSEFNSLNGYSQKKALISNWIQQNDYLIVTHEDKYLYDNAKVITWWTSKHYDQGLDTQSMDGYRESLNNIRETGKTIYVLEEALVKVPQLQKLVSEDRIGVQMIDESLYALVWPGEQ